MWLLKKFANCNNINIVNPLYIMIEISKKYNEVWEGIKKEIETINGGKKNWIWERLKKS